MRLAALRRGCAVALLAAGWCLAAGSAAAEERTGLLFAVLGKPYSSQPASQELLRGLQGVNLFGRDVNVGPVSINVDSMLQHEGVPVSPTLSEKTPRLTISIALTRMHRTHEVSHMVTLSVTQPVTLARDPSMKADLVTWVASAGPTINGTTEQTDPVVAATEIAGLVRKFAAAYHAANP